MERNRKRGVGQGRPCAPILGAETQPATRPLSRFRSLPSPLAGWKPTPAQPARADLLAQTEPVDNALVPLGVVALQVVQKTPAPAHPHDQAAPGCMVLAMSLEVVGQRRDPLAQQRDLHFGRTGVAGVQAMLLDQA